LKVAGHDSWQLGSQEGHGPDRDLTF
jgi:hypothetical protein